MIISKKKISKIKKYLDIINKIEKVRSKNNVNWMDVLRVALKHAPDETIRLMKNINQKDKKISNLFNSIK
ncbi:hypothetical protein N8267_00685 [Pelagibacteraceae bacterium]|nr:hypothetical protein [Pelagibacteraceae bacterium]|tara:strand:+ start:101 stop:310 length:210 start_codon:yes stop_codon:yes gene_type:complete